MHCKSQSLFRAIWGAATAALLLIALALVLSHTQTAHAQTFQVLHTLTGADGSWPASWLTLDAAGNLYGTAAVTRNDPYCDDIERFSPACGTLFKLSSEGFTVLHTFAGHVAVLGDGSYPLDSGVIFGPDGGLYGTTQLGGLPGGAGAGTVYEYLAPREKVLYRFQGYPEFPSGPVVFDPAGNLYGTTPSAGFGTVFMLTPSDEGWMESVIYTFYGGGAPFGGVIFDNAGNLYGATNIGGGTGCDNGCGAIFELSPSPSGWTYQTLYDFHGGSDGGKPFGGLIFDRSGNLYGTTTAAGPANAGTVFELSPSNGTWTFSVLYSLNGTGQAGTGPTASLVMDGAGNLFGTAPGAGVYGLGSAFKLMPSDGGWTYTSLHDFAGGRDGALPYGGVILDAEGNLYGAAAAGSVIYKITP